MTSSYLVGTSLPAFWAGIGVVEPQSSALCSITDDDGGRRFDFGAGRLPRISEPDLRLGETRIRQEDEEWIPPSAAVMQDRRTLQILARTLLEKPKRLIDLFRSLDPSRPEDLTRLRAIGSALRQHGPDPGRSIRGYFFDAFGPEIGERLWGRLFPPLDTGPIYPRMERKTPEPELLLRQAQAQGLGDVVVERLLAYRSWSEGKGRPATGIHADPALNGIWTGLDEDGQGRLQHALSGRYHVIHRGDSAAQFFNLVRSVPQQERSGRTNVVPSGTEPEEDVAALQDLAKRVAVQRHRGTIALFAHGHVDAPDMDETPPVLAEAMAKMGGGSPLSDEVRTRMEERLGIDLRGVRIHTGPEAEKACAALGAAALTIGTDIFFGKGRSPQDEDLLAHELGHVWQGLTGRMDQSGSSLKVTRRTDPLEKEADQIAAQIRQGQARLPEADPRTASAPVSAWNHSPSRAARLVALYETGEHAAMGCGPLYPYPEASGSEVVLPNGAKAYPGEIVALMGDFYASLEQLERSSPHETRALVGLARIEAVWLLAARLKRARETGRSPESLSRLEVYADRDRLSRRDWETVPDGLASSFHSLRSRIFKEFAPEWKHFGVTVPFNQPPNTSLYATLFTMGRRRFLTRNDAVTPGEDPAHHGADYLQLAQNNTSHFSVKNLETWKTLHARAAERHRGAKDDAERTKAVVEDMGACHFLTDGLAAGHLIQKQAIMVDATDLMAFAGREKKVEGGRNEVLTKVLGEALDECLEDEIIGRQWELGIDDAFRQGSINRNEWQLMRGLPKNTGPVTVSAKVRDVIMGMPWRLPESFVRVSEAERSYGPEPENPGAKGTYHLGVGNIAAKWVHDFFNAVGFRVTNGRGETWRMQGDEYLTAETLKIGGRITALSRRQVEEGRSDPEEIFALMPREAMIDPEWVRTYFSQWKEGGASFDEAAIEDLCRYVEGLKIPVGVAALHEKIGMSAEFQEVARRVMKILFLSPGGKGQEKGQDKGQDKGLNISMFRAFLREHLREMAAMAYMVLGPTDLPKAVLEDDYPPWDPQQGVLPTAVKDLQFGHGALHFSVDVTRCQPDKDYKLGVVWVRRKGRPDRTEGGDRIGPGFSERSHSASEMPRAVANAGGLVRDDVPLNDDNPDFVTVHVPDKSQTMPDTRDRQFVWGKVYVPRGMDKNAYALIFVEGDNGRMYIGRSSTLRENGMSNSD